MDRSALGQFIKQRREFLHLRQEDLAQLSQVNTRTIHLIEQGTGNPSVATLNKIAEVLGLELKLSIKQIN